MNLVKRAYQTVAAGLSLSDFDRVLDAMYGGQPSYSGKSVSQQNSLGVPTVWACTNVLSSDIATIPFVTYRKVKDGKEPAPDHYLWRLLLQESNPELTAFRFKQIMQTWLCLWGNAYAEIEISGRGQVVGLWPWRPDRTSVWRQGGPFGQLMYTYTMQDNRKFTVPHDRMLHIRGMSLDGVMGLSPIEAHRQTVGLSMAMLEHTARFYANGARPLGVLEHPGKLSPKAEQSLKDSWAKGHEGLSNAHRVAILEEGMKYQEVGIKPVDAQYIQTAGLTQEDIAAIYNMPQYKVGILTHATFSNVEWLGLDYILGTCNPWTTNWHQEIERSCLSAREQETILVRPNFKSRLRGDHAAMSKFITDLWGRGIITADEAREEYLDMNPLPDGVGKLTYVPVNMAPAGEDNFGAGIQQMKPAQPPSKKQPPPEPDAKPANGKTNGLAGH